MLGDAHKNDGSYVRISLLFVLLLLFCFILLCRFAYFFVRNRFVMVRREIARPGLSRRGLYISCRRASRHVVAWRVVA